ncbi:uncharacterized protein [Cherax quadricarinatus]|uniref:uncharacterized protein n=1 Tax=Cherax quadricarinatus TaxID=27406 RepID=UPI00387E405A
MTTGVRVPAGVSSDVLVPLPTTRRVHLNLSDVVDANVNDACDVAQELQPPRGYTEIMCESSTLTEAGIEDLIRGLAYQRVEMNWLVVHSSVTITQQQEDELVSLAHSTLGCPLYIYDS